MLRKKALNFSDNNKFNICDLLILDHSYLKECVLQLKNEKIDKKIKYKTGKTFLDALHKHSQAEKKCVYKPLLNLDKFKKDIIEGEIEHEIADQKCAYLIKKLKYSRSLSDELEIELKVLAEIVRHHITEEETNLIVKMRSSLSSEVLDEMGLQFMKLRKFSEKDLADYPVLRNEVRAIGRLSTRIPNNFVAKIIKGQHRYTR